MKTRSSVGWIVLVAAIAATLSLLACGGGAEPDAQPPPAKVAEPIEPPPRLEPAGAITHVGFERYTADHPCAANGSSVIKIYIPSATYHYVWPPASIATAQAAFNIASMPDAQWNTPTGVSNDSFSLGCVGCTSAVNPGPELVFNNIVVTALDPTYWTITATATPVGGGSAQVMNLQLTAMTWLPFATALGSCLGQTAASLQLPATTQDANIVFLIGDTHTHSVGCK